jgi:hypothetical protein
MRSRVLAAALAGFCLIGAGCWSSFDQQFPPLPGTQAEVLPIESVSSTEATARLRLIGGDTFELQQTLFGLGAYLSQVSQAQLNARRVEVNHFIPHETAALTWTVTVDEQKLDHIEEFEASGTISGIDLRRSHTLSNPLYWEPRDMQLVESSALWLSDDAYQELVNTGKTVVNFGVTDEAANTILKNMSEMQSAWDRLRNSSVQQSVREDITLVKAVAPEEEYPLTVNGKEIKVKVIRARNWFGEIVVLKNPENPLVLKLSLNPLTYGAAGAVAKSADLKNVFGYEIAKLNVHAP